MHLSSVGCSPSLFCTGRPIYTSQSSMLTEIDSVTVLLLTGLSDYNNSPVHDTLDFALLNSAMPNFACTLLSHGEVVGLDVEPYITKGLKNHHPMKPSRFSLSI